ncbi:chromogranin-A-like isoform X2 [Rhincodon typus]|uniref:chromogranin-A-like isoform X2 n=1 Tax=Rhincodon typus TaxID=259920 RepID=UPI00202EABCE|nr:chromogranin-A-like isoform X2 [Rhincodon typus]
MQTPLTPQFKMICNVFLAWILFCSQVTSRPPISELPREDQTVTKCIAEAISDTLSKPDPLPVSSKCKKILKEDERILAMVRHQNLLKELEELTHFGEIREGSTERNDKKWNYLEEESVESKEREDMKKQYMLDKKTSRAEIRDDISHRGRANSKKDVPLKREEDLGKYEGSEEELREQHDYKVMNGEDDTKLVLHESEEELTDDDKRSPDRRHRVSSEEEDSLSREDEQEDHNVLKIDELIEKIAREELEDEDDEQAEEQKHHTKEYGSKKRSKEAPGHVKKRVEENASDEETDQFETEEKGVKVFDSKSHMHESDDKRSLEKKSQDKKRHHLQEEGVGLKRQDDELEYLEERRHDIENNKEEEEDEEEEEKEERRQLHYEEYICLLMMIVSCMAKDA